MSRRALIAMILLVATGCSHSHHSSAAVPIVPTPACTGPPHDSTQNVVLQGADPASLTRSLEARLRLAGEQCPTASLSPTTTSVGIPASAMVLHLHWIGMAGEDPLQSQYAESFILRPGNLAFRSIVGDTAGACTGGKVDLSGTAPANVTVAGRCVRVSAALADHVRLQTASAAPTADPMTWTLRFELEPATAARLAGKPVFASVDGLSLGRAAVAGTSVTTSGHFDGGGTEARCTASNVQIPIAPVGGYTVVS